MLKRRVRKTVKWSMSGLTVLLLVVWIGSGWWELVWLGPWDWSANVQGGRFFVMSPSSAAPSGWLGLFYFGSHPFRFAWWFKQGLQGTGFYCFLPLWPAALLSLLATAAAWRADAKYIRRVRVGLCAGCGYDRAGLKTDAVCPECGNQPETR
jgi:hypothetical protein